MQVTSIEAGVCVVCVCRNTEDVDHITFYFQFDLSGSQYTEVLLNV